LASNANISATFNETFNATVTQLQIVSGNNQSATVNAAFGAPLVVQVNNGAAPVAGATVNFTVTSGSATLSSSTAITNSLGQAQVSVTAGSVANGVVIMATVSGLTLTFNLTITPAGPSINPAITLTSVPPFGSSAPLTGSVSGVPPANYVVAPLIFVEGLGWYSKPTCATDVVPIQPDGSWSIAGGIDPAAIRIAAFLIPAGAPPSCTVASDGLPAPLVASAVAQIVVNRPDPNAPVIHFAGYPWNTKNNNVPINPGPCVFSNSANNVFVDGAGALHLRITNTNGGWTCAEIYSKRVFGFGHFTFTITSPPPTDPNVVLGLFTWSDDDPSFAHREIDVEMSRFGNAGDPNNAQFVVQPANLPNHLMRFLAPAVGSINSFEWRPHQVNFSSLQPNRAVTSQWTATAQIPPQGDQNARLNFWLNNGAAPSAPAEAVISNFTFVPEYTDFDGDGTTDLAIWRPATGTWWVNSSSTGTFSQQQWGLPGDIPVPGDYDRDGQLDFAVWRPANGTWYIIPSSNPAMPIIQQWGLPGDIPLAGDFDGDGQTDFAVWRPSNGTWYIIPSSNPGKPIIRQWGLPGDVPMVGDFDSDGKTDLAVWRPTNGEWYIIPSGNPIAPIFQQWGLPGDMPAPGDYDGDGQTDFAVWRPTNGTWYIIPSSNPGTPIIQQWGLPGDIPVPRDYNNDNRTDMSVWRPANGVWYILSSSTGVVTQTQWGLPGDVPIYLSPLVPLTINAASVNCLGGLGANCPTTQTTATGGVPPYRWSLAAGSLPPGLTLNPSTGAIAGTTTSTGSYPVTLGVTDSLGSVATASQTVLIGPL